ncbi:preprotein translocase subunit SecE [Patescibacteria group bacterium]|nr:preprotein translocase subunit SecE [Patescibacteria group bacterium]MBU1931807.1 preprotein translocase subunit SecE [Patescibacteria group bacterium]
MKKKSKKALPLIGFFNQARAELKKVTWPNKEAVIKMTIIVIVVSVAVGGFIGLLDYLFISITSIIIK